MLKTNISEPNGKRPPSLAHLIREGSYLLFNIIYKTVTDNHIQMLGSFFECFGRAAQRLDKFSHERVCPRH